MKHLLVLAILLGLVGAPAVNAQGPRIPLTPQNASSIDVLTQMGNGTANHIEWAPDGSTLTIAGGRGIWFYDAVNPDEPLYTIDRHSVPVMRAEYSFDGTLLAWCDSESLSMSNRNTGMILWESESAQCGRHLAFSPDGVWLATNASNELIQIWNVATGALARELQNPGGTKSLAFLLNGTLVSGDWEGRIHWWKVRDGIEIRSAQGMADIMAVSPEGDIVATTQDMGGEIVLWDAAGQQVGTLQGWVSAMLFVPGHKLLGINKDGGFALWNTDTGELVENEFYITLANCYSPSFSPDWQTLALDCPLGVVLFDMSSREPRYVLETFSGMPDRLVFSPDGTLLASADFNSPVARLWHAGYGKQLASLWEGTDNADDVVFMPDGSLLGTPTREGMLQWWRTRDGTPDAVLRPGEGSYWHAELSPDGTILALARWKPQGTPALLQLWDADGERLVYELSLGESEGWITEMAFNPDGSRLAVIADALLYLIDPYRGIVEQVLGPYDYYLSDLDFSGDGAILAYIEGKWQAPDTVHLWNMGFGVEMGTLDPSCGDTDDSQAVAISPINNLAVTGCNDGSIWLWDVAHGTHLRTLYGQYAAISDLAFSADGTLLASGSWDGTIMLWGVP